VGVFLYCTRAVDPTLLCAVIKISPAQAQPTQAVLKATELLIQYAASHPAASIVYHASDMCLIVHTDASYLSESHARSRARGFHFLGNHGAVDEQYENGAIKCMSTITPAVTSSAAEYAAAFLNDVDAESIRHTLSDMGFAYHLRR
jgi:hypothetical protein